MKQLYSLKCTTCHTTICKPHTNISQEFLKRFRLIVLFLNILRLIITKLHVIQYQNSLTCTTYYTTMCKPHTNISQEFLKRFRLIVLNILILTVTKLHVIHYQHKCRSVYLIRQIVPHFLSISFQRHFAVDLKCFDEQVGFLKKFLTNWQVISLAMYDFSFSITSIQFSKVFPLTGNARSLKTGS